MQVKVSDGTSRIARRLAEMATKSPERMARQKRRDVANVRKAVEEGTYDKPGRRLLDAGREFWKP